MSYITAAGFDVSEMRLCSPLCGAWHADLYVLSDSDLQGAVPIDIGGALTLQGTAFVGGVYTGTLSVRVVAGKGGWSQPMAPKFYHGASIGTMLRDILSQGGESLSSTADATATGIVPQAFSATSGTVGANVKALMAYAPAGTSWRFLPSGEFWIGPEAWPAFGEDYAVITENPSERSIDIGFEFPTLMAGMSIEAEAGTVHVSRVETAVSASAFRARVWYV